MQTRPYTDLFDTTQALCGVVFAGIEKGRIKALVNRRARRAYRASNYWTRFLAVGEARQVVDGVVEFEQYSLSPIDTFLRIFVDQPYNVTSNQEYQFTVGPTGAKLMTGGFTPDTAYVTYKAQFLDTYGAGVSTSDPSGVASDVTSVPYEWFDYMAYGAYADYLRAEGQQEKAALADQEANDILLDELMKLDEQHTQTIISPRIFTNSNMQVRYGGPAAVGSGSSSTGDGLFPTDVATEGDEVILLEDDSLLTTEG